MVDYHWSKGNNRMIHPRDQYSNHHTVPVIEIHNPISGDITRMSVDNPHSSIGDDPYHYQRDIQHAIDTLMNNPDLIFKFLISNEDILEGAIAMVRETQKPRYNHVNSAGINLDEPSEKDAAEYEEALTSVEYYDENGIHDEDDQEEYDINLEIVKSFEKA